MRGARLLNALSIRCVHKSGGSKTCESEERISLSGIRSPEPLQQSTLNVGLVRQRSQRRFRRQRSAPAPAPHRGRTGATMRGVGRIVGMVSVRPSRTNPAGIMRPSPGSTIGTLLERVPGDRSPAPAILRPAVLRQTAPLPACSGIRRPQRPRLLPHLLIRSLGISHPKPILGTVEPRPKTATISLISFCQLKPRGFKLGLQARANFETINHTKSCSVVHVTGPSVKCRPK